MKKIIITGAPFNRGAQLGKECEAIAYKLQDQFRERWAKKNVTTEEAVRWSRKFLPYAEDFYDSYVQELRGYAYATEIPFAEIFAWLCYDPPPKGCTDLAFSHRMTRDGHVYLVHNEDYDVQEEDCAVLVEMHPRDEPSFLAVTYGGIWFNAGVNEHGIAIAGNGLDHSDSQIGIPGDFSFRKTLTARILSEAMHFCTPEGRSFSYCNIIADKYGEIYAMEGTATDFAAIHARNFLAHSNHYNDPKMADKYEAGFTDLSGRSPSKYASTIYRQHRAENLVIDLMHPVAKKDMIAIMSDHANHPWSICRHIDYNLPESEQSKTVFSEIIDVTEQTIYICKGNPCENEYVLHKLNLR